MRVWHPSRLRLARPRGPSWPWCLSRWIRGPCPSSSRARTCRSCIALDPSTLGAHTSSSWSQTCPRWLSIVRSPPMSGRWRARLVHGCSRRWVCRRATRATRTSRSWTIGASTCSASCAAQSPLSIVQSQATHWRLPRLTCWRSTPPCTSPSRPCPWSSTGTSAVIRFSFCIPPAFRGRVHSTASVTCALTCVRRLRLSWSCATTFLTTLTGMHVRKLSSATPTTRVWSPRAIMPLTRASAWTCPCFCGCTQCPRLRDTGTPMPRARATH